MKNPVYIIVLSAIMLLAIASHAAAEGLPVSKYLEDPEHKNEIVQFYLSSVYTGIILANSRIAPPLFCMSDANSESPFTLIDKRIQKLQKEKRLTEETTIDSIMMDLLIDEFPCKKH